MRPVVAAAPTDCEPPRGNAPRLAKPITPDERAVVHSVVPLESDTSCDHTHAWLPPFFQLGHSVSEQIPVGWIRSSLLLPHMFQPLALEGGQRWDFFVWFSFLVELGALVSIGISTMLQ